MGCDIHSYVERQVDGVWRVVLDQHPFDHRNYGVFGFLADVRNYSGIDPIDGDAPTRGVPEDASPEYRERVEYWEGDGHSHSWFTLEELLAVDYNKVIWDRRVTRNNDGGCTTDDPAEGKRVPLRDFLGLEFMCDLEVLKGLGKPDEVRVVFFFDN